MCIFLLRSSINSRRARDHEVRRPGPDERLLRQVRFEAQNQGCQISQNCRQKV